MKNQQLPYRGFLIQLARKNRKTMTKGETILWSRIRRRQIAGVKFSRQIVIKSFIVDFFSKELNLAIEIQGYSHTLPEVIEKDQHKFEVLNSMGIHVLEIDDQLIFRELDNAIKLIHEKVNEIQSPV